MLKKFFVPHKQAMALKELGFDEPCICVFNNNKSLKSNITSNIMGDKIEKDPHDFRLNAPLYSQAFNWFRKKYQLSGEPQSYQFSYSYNIIYDTLGDNTCKALEKDFDTFPKAELACLKKLIELCQNSK